MSQEENVIGAKQICLAPHLQCVMLQIRIPYSLLSWRAFYVGRCWTERSYRCPTYTTGQLAIVHLCQRYNFVGGIPVQMSHLFKWQTCQVGTRLYRWSNIMDGTYLSIQETLYGKHFLCVWITHEGILVFEFWLASWSMLS